MRRLVDVSGLSVADPCPFVPEKSLGEVLMEPTLYLRPCRTSSMQNEEGGWICSYHRWRFVGEHSACVVSEHFL